VPDLTEPPNLALPGLGIALAAREHWSRAGMLAPAAAITRGLVAALADRLGDRHVDVLAEIGVLGTLALRAGRADRAVDLLREAWEGLRERGAVDRLPALARWLAEALEAQSRAVEADRVLDVTLGLVEGRPAAPAVALLLAEARLRRGDPARAANVAEAAWRASARPSPALARQVGRLLLTAGEPARALPALRVLVAAARSEEARAEGLALLVVALDGAGLRDEATRTMDQALSSARRAGGAALPGRLAAAAPLLASRGRVQEAEALLTEALEAERRVGPEDGAGVARRLVALGRFLGRQGRSDEAAGFLEAGVGMLRRAGDPDEVLAAQAELVTTLTGEARRLAHVGDRELAGAWAAQASRAADALPAGHEAARAAKALRVG
jgi:tetratricopeptide (TPR) repeat protein